ncbi:hypothetical protein T484DRAFT_2023832, partial [Baffinella frigidus]
MEAPPAASTCPPSDTSLDNQSTKNAGKRPRDDATASGGSSSPSSKQFCRADLRVKTASPPRLEEPVEDECPAARSSPLACESGTRAAADANQPSMTQQREQRCSGSSQRATKGFSDRLRWGSSIIFMISKACHLETSSHAFGLAISLLHRA